MKKIVLGTTFLGSLLISCNLLSGADSGCSSYNKIAEDGFRMSIDQSPLVLAVGGTGDIGLEQSWLDIVNNTLVRRDITCRPNWSYSTPGIVEVDKSNTKKLNGLSPGVVRVTAAVTGYASVSESFWALVNPVPTESNQPNDTFELANSLSSSVIGTIVGSDVDFYKVQIPANKQYRISLTNSVTLNNNFFASYDTVFYNSNKNTISTPVVNRLEGSNTTAQAIQIIIQVTGSSNSDTPYKLQVELF